MTRRLLLTLLGLWGCGAPAPAPAPPAADAPPLPTPGAAQPVDGDPCDAPGSWTRTGQPFLLTWCSGCHSAGRVGDDRYGAPEAVSLDTLADAVAWQDRILARVEDGTMPPGGGPPAAEQARLALWFACGAPGVASTAGPGAEPGGAVAADTVVVISAGSGGLPGGTDWILRSGDLVAGTSSVTRVVETYDIDGEDAWLWSRELRDADGAVWRRWTWDPPLPVGQAGADAWSAETTVTLADDGGAVTSWAQGWSFERAAASGVDGWSIDDAPVAIVGLADDGAEEGWHQSSRWGITGRWWLDDVGVGVIYQQALDQPAGAFGAGFPVVAGDRRGGRIVELEGAP